MFLFTGMYAGKMMRRRKMNKNSTSGPRDGFYLTQL
jgi:hypothetical protein